MRSQLSIALSLVLVFVISLGMYLYTLAPTVTLIDSGELILAAWGLDIPHPPGFPLYVLLGWLFSRLPVGNVAQRLNAMSALFGALASTMVFVVVRQTLSWPQRSEASGPDRRQPRPPLSQSKAPLLGIQSVLDFQESLIPAIVAALSFAFSFTLWRWATVAEVYTLNAFIMGVVLSLLIAWQKAQGEVFTGPSQQSGQPGLLYAAAFLAGLGLGNHHVSILLLGPAILYWMLQATKWRLRWRREAWIALLSFILGLSVYLYLPLRAAQGPLLNWGNPRNWERFWWHITGKQYQVYLLPFSIPGVLQRLALGLRLLWRQFAPLGLILALVGLWSFWPKERRLLAFTGLVVFSNIAYVVNYDLVPDIDAYYLPTIWIMSVWIGWGSWRILKWLARRKASLGKAWSACGLILFLVPALIAWQNYRSNNRRAYYIAADYAENALRGMDANGLLLTDDWDLYAPLLYLQHVENARPDVAVIDLSLWQNRSWYHDYLARQYPALIASIREERAAFLEQLDLFEHDRLTDSREISRRYQRLMEALINRNIQTRPIYLSRRVPAHLQGHGVQVSYAMAPEGLLFRLYPQAAPLNPPRLILETRGLADGSILLDEAALGVRETYIAMLINRGLYLSNNQLFPEAASAYKEALSLDPDNNLAQRLLTQAEAAVQSTLSR